MERSITNCRPAMFLIAPLHCFYLLLFDRLPVGHHCCSYYFHDTHLYLHRGAFFVDHRVGTFIGQRRRRRSQKRPADTGPKCRIGSSAVACAAMQPAQLMNACDSIDSGILVIFIPEIPELRVSKFRNLGLIKTRNFRNFELRNCDHYVRGSFFRPSAT